MTGSKEKSAESGWVGYRPGLKILDCTIRDGGLINDHLFNDEAIKHVYKSCVEAGVDYMEFGYKASKRIYSPSQYGPWKFCTEDDLRRIVDDNPTDLKISVMADAERCDYKEDILPKDQSVIDCVRVACYIHQIPLAMDMVQDAHEKGYETLLQLMAVSVVSESDLAEALDLVAKSPASATYIVDSFGSLYSEQVRELTTTYLKAMEGTGKDIGFHGHNNQQLAFANTLEALIVGANRVDATFNGIGRGAGNCPMELLLGFLHNPKFRIRPVLECCGNILAPLAKEIEWGYTIPYGITGSLNQHPREAIKWRASETRDDYVTFYDNVTEED